MEKKNKKIIHKAEQIITKYRDDDSIYYHELVKSFKEYKELENLDKTTNDLYIEHINRLCEFIVERKNSNIIIAVMLFIFLVLLGLTAFSTYRYYNITKNLENSIVKANATTNLLVAYKDLENFNAMTLSDSQSYMDLKPLLIKLTSNSDSLKEYKIRYNIYIVEENDELPENSLLNREVFLYNVSGVDKNSGIKSLKEATIKNNRLLIYTGLLDSKMEEEIEIRMWLDKNSKIDYQNKLYKFKLYVDGYVL